MQHQTPINIIHRNVDSTKTKNDLKILYTPTTLMNEVENNGHSIQFDFEASDSMCYKKRNVLLKTNTFS